MEDNQYRNWKVKFKSFSLIALLLGGLGTAYKYLEDRKIEAEQLEEGRKKDQNSLVFQHQATLYFETARAAATIAAALDSKAADAKAIDAKTLKEARERFAQLFWGELAPIEDRRVELATIAFQRCLLGEACERLKVNQHNDPIDNTDLDKVSPPTMRALSLEVGSCIRTALQKDRDIEFVPHGSPVKVEHAITPCPYD